MGFIPRSWGKTLRRTVTLLLALLFLGAPGLTLVPGQPLSGNDWWRIAAWAISTAAFLALLLLSGAQLRGYASGLLIDRRNRYSLSRLQIVAWTVLAIPALVVALGNNALRAGDVSGFPELALDWTLVALMGISLGSFVATPLALSVRAQRTPDPAEVEKSRERIANRENLDAASVSARGSLVEKALPADARVIDFVTGEEVGNAATLDIARIQMLAITAVVWTTYGVMLFRILLAGGEDGFIVAHFPTFDNTLLALVLVSHAGYITGKVAPNTPRQSDTATRNVARTLTLLAGVDSLGSQIDSAITLNRVTVAEERQLKRLREQIDQIRSNAEKARDSLKTGQDIFDTVATLEGQLAAVKRAFRSIISEGERPSDVDEPGPDLIRDVKQGLAGALGRQLSAGEAWTDVDEDSLQAFLKEKGLTRDDLSRVRYRAFEDVLDLLK